MTCLEPPTSDNPDFTSSFKVLDEILERFKQGNPSLEESLALFESGVQHLRICQEKLSQAKGSVEELVATLQAGGEAITQPFKD